MEKYIVVYGDGIHDDTEALRMIANGKAKGITPSGKPIEEVEIRCKITKPIEISSNIKKSNKLNSADAKGRA